MQAREIVVREVQGHRRKKVLDLLAKAIGKASEPAHGHAGIGALSVIGGFRKPPKSNQDTTRIRGKLLKRGYAS